ncbi:MAG: hypothetical protein IPJ65_06005 [Archangiaceae bacterium]|nr:hypothetical protein [Archangiaceae bacterium]
MRHLLAIAAATALCACPNNKKPDPDPDAGPTEFVGRACNVDAECGSLRCDKVRRQCICLSDESCKSSDPAAPVRYCNNYTGLCVAEISGCTSDSSCDNTQYCDPSIRACRPLKSFCETCGADNECGGAGDDCVLDLNLQQKFCGKDCLQADGGPSNAACPRGATCQPQDGGYQCWPSESSLPGQVASCKNFKGCTPDSLRTCNNDQECADGSQRCDPAQGKCVAIEQVCPFGTTCDPRAKICIADCAVDEDCGDPSLRCNNRVCEPIGECTEDLECPANKICSVPPAALSGTCAPFCATDLDCPIGQTCQMGQGRYKCQPGCTTNQNCPLDQRCNSTTKACEGPQVGTARVCQSTSACSTCELCNPARYECESAKTAFPHCQTCSSPFECGGGACVALSDGQFCLRYCVTGSECPQGFVCLGLSGGSTQSVCVPSSRSCGGKCP